MNEYLNLGMSINPPCQPWGINFGGGLNSTALIIECRNRCLKPDWILFADTGSEMPGTIEHVNNMAKWCKGWADITTVRWERVKGDIIGFEPLHENCLRTSHLPSKAYGLAGCTSKWKIQPMDRWRKSNGLQTGAFAVGYDADEKARIKKACQRGDDPKFTAWYPLVSWGIGRDKCNQICLSEGIEVGKSSCFMCPNMKAHEWKYLFYNNIEMWNIAVQIENNARSAGNLGRGELGLGFGGLEKLRDRGFLKSIIVEEKEILEDRCHHGGCFT